MKSSIFIFGFVLYVEGTILHLDDVQYKQMPAVVSLDDYHSCLADDGHYCTGYVAFVADTPSPLLTMMQEYSAHTATRYNHTKSLYGVCLSNCKEFYKNEDTPDLSRVLEACLNRSVSEQYNLKVKVEDGLSCYGKEKRFEVGTAEIAVAGVVMALLIINCIGSFFDIYCPKLHQWPGATILLSFSTPRHWRKLISPASKEPKLVALRGLSGIRVVMTILVVVSHKMLPIILIPADTQLLESLYEVDPLHVFINGSIIMQTFMFISAMLLVYNMLEFSQNYSITWVMVPAQIFKRFWRLTPAYALVLAVNATWLKFAATGPIWDMLVTNEVDQCKQYWWTHLLYINNYQENNSICMLQSWSLATDVQLYCFGVIAFYFCQKTSHKKFFLSSLLIIGILIPGLHTYFEDLDGNVIISPSLVERFFLEDPTYSKIYRRGHTNLASFVLGMIAGYLLHHLQTRNIDVTKFRKWRPLYWCIIPILLSIILVCKELYKDAPRMDMTYRVLMASFLNPAFTFFSALFILGMILKVEDGFLFTGLLEWEGWTTPARLTYSVYLLHVPMLRVAYGTLTETVAFTSWHIVDASFWVSASFIAAASLYLTVEAPLATLASTCTGSGERDQPTANGYTGNNGWINHTDDYKKTK